MRDEDLPDQRQDELEDDFDAALRGDDEQAPPSLAEDIAALASDGRTYVEAEIAFQKSRAAYSASHGKSAALFGLFALGFVHLALIGLVVGALFALAPLLTPWGATATVVGALLLGALVLLLMMRRHTRAIGDAFRSERDD